MAPKVKNHQNPCFCTLDCAPTTKPYFNYRVASSSALFPEYLNGRWYQFVGTGDFGQCFYSPQNPLSGYTREQLVKFTGCSGAFDHSWEWKLHLINTAGDEQFFSGCRTWNDGDDLDDIITAASCEEAGYDFISISIPPHFASITAIPIYMCSEAQVEAWPLT